LSDIKLILRLFCGLHFAPKKWAQNWEPKGEARLSGFTFWLTRFAPIYRAQKWSHPVLCGAAGTT